MLRWRLDIAYDGAGFAGWATQPGQRTVAGALTGALTQLTRWPAARLTVAGRTDAGVHATGQVAHVDLPESVDGPQLLHRLARVLPADLRVTALTVAPDGFDARFAALWRRYEYRITDAPTGPDPLRRGFVLAWPRRRAGGLAGGLADGLDVAAMGRAAGLLVGEHDFAAFCRARAGATTIRELQSLTVARASGEGVGEIVVTVRADAFCHSMVRSLVGALLAVGDGRRPPTWPAGLLTRDQRADEVAVAPAHGLTLVAVGYPPDDQLRARAAQTRQRRVQLS